MAKLPYMQFYPADWLLDLAPHSLEIKGAWITICCHLWRAETRGELTMNLGQWGGILGVDPDRAAEIIAYLAESKIASASLSRHGVTQRDEKVTVVCRRIAREERGRNSHAKRQVAYRQRKSDALSDAQSDGGVTPHISEYIFQKSDPPYIPPRGTCPSDPIPDHSDLPSAALFDDLPKAKKRIAAKASTMPKARPEESPHDFHARYMAWATSEATARLAANRELWSKAYPAVDLDQAVARALSWLGEKPENRKSQIGSFLTRWLGKDQDNGGTRGRSTPGRDSRSETHDEFLARRARLDAEIARRDAEERAKRQCH